MPPPALIANQSKPVTITLALNSCDFSYPFNQNISFSLLANFLCQILLWMAHLLCHNILTCKPQAKYLRLWKAGLCGSTPAGNQGRLTTFLCISGACLKSYTKFRQLHMTRPPSQIHLRWFYNYYIFSSFSVLLSCLHLNPRHFTFLPSIPPMPPCH